MSGWKYDDASEKFSENMKSVVMRSIYPTLDGVDMVSMTVIFLRQDALFSVLISGTGYLGHRFFSRSL